MPGHFDTHADDWISWTRTPGVDIYDTVSRRGLWPLLPQPRELTLDLGCGEGRVSRDLIAEGHRVVGMDLSERLLGAARTLDPCGRYALADAARIPVRNDAVDLVVAFNVLMDVDDLGAACQEIGRVLRPDGRVCVCVTHPFTDAVDRVMTSTGQLRNELTRPYTGTHPFDSVAERRGVRMHFRGWSHDLDIYFRAFAQGGLVVERLREVTAPESAVAAQPSLAEFAGLPLFLVMRLALEHK